MATPYRIVVVESGWVLCGDIVKTGDPVMDDHHMTLHSANVITRWGTTKGLGELALGGPTTDSLVHPCGIAEIPHSKILFTLDVQPDQRSKWPT